MPLMLPRRRRPEHLRMRTGGASLVRSQVLKGVSTQHLTAPSSREESPDLRKDLDCTLQSILILYSEY